MEIFPYNSFPLNFRLYIAYSFNKSSICKIFLKTILIVLGNIKIVLLIFIRIEEKAI